VTETEAHGRRPHHCAAAKRRRAEFLLKRTTVYEDEFSEFGQRGHYGAAANHCAALSVDDRRKRVRGILWTRLRALLRSRGRRRGRRSSVLSGSRLLAGRCLLYLASWALGMAPRLQSLGPWPLRRARLLRQLPDYNLVGNRNTSAPDAGCVERDKFPAINAMRLKFRLRHVVRNSEVFVSGSRADDRKIQTFSRANATRRSVLIRSSAQSALPTRPGVTRRLSAPRRGTGGCRICFRAASSLSRATRES
jgi:hypothetical protein